MGTIHARKTSPHPHTCLQTCSIEKQLKHRELKKRLWIFWRWIGKGQATNPCHLWTV